MAITKRITKKNMKNIEVIVIDEQALEFTPVDLTAEDFLKELEKKTVNEIKNEIMEKGSSEQNVHLQTKKKKSKYKLKRNRARKIKFLQKQIQDGLEYLKQNCN
nr:uncharacterized protein LOC124810965 [Hydra vulgaris]XP_047140418.1 uncharacterized protein LOC124815690 [Hydra vulgaris]